MPDGPITRSELWHAHAQLETHITQQIDRVERRLDGFVTRAEFDAWKADVEELKASKRQHSHLFVGAFLYPVLVAVIVALVLTAR